MRTLVITLLACTLVWGCKTTEPAEDQYDISLSGTVENPKGESITIRGPKDFKIEATLDSTGHFAAEFDIENAGFYSFRHGAENSGMYLEPGFDINIVLETSEFDESITYEGAGSAYNNYLAGLYLLDENISEGNPYQERYLVDAATYAAKAADATAQKSEYAKSAVMKMKLDQKFVTEQCMGFKYEEYIALADYRMGAAHYQDRDIEEIETPADYLAIGEDLPMDNEEMLEHQPYIRYVDSRLRTATQDKMAAMEEAGEDVSKELLAHSVKMKLANEALTTEKVKNHFLHAAMMDVVSYSGAQDLTAIVEEFKALCNNQECITAVEEEVAAWRHLWAGEPAPGFEYASIDGEKVSLASLEGKAVYIDVWATWCGPCKGEIPHLKDLEHDMHGQNVAFVSVSIDEDKEAWQAMVNDKELGGIQLLGDAAWESSICEDYKIMGIPRFILIGTDGDIVSADAPRPSSGDEIREMIEAAMYGDDLAVVE